jgi:hypothetical protein
LQRVEVAQDIRMIGLRRAAERFGIRRVDLL